MKEGVIRIPDTSHLTEKYVGKWVALSSDYKRVLTSGETLEQVFKETSKEKNRVIFRVFPKLKYVPRSQV